MKNPNIINPYNQTIDDFKQARQEAGMSSQEVAGQGNCQVYSFEKKRRIIRLDTFVAWLDKMGYKIQLVKETKQK